MLTFHYRLLSLAKQGDNLFGSIYLGLSRLCTIGSIQLCTACPGMVNKGAKEGAWAAWYLLLVYEATPDVNVYCERAPFYS